MKENIPTPDSNATSENITDSIEAQSLPLIRLIPLPRTLALGEQMEPGVAYTPRITIPR